MVTNADLLVHTVGEVDVAGYPVDGYVLGTAET